MRPNSEAYCLLYPTYLPGAVGQRPCILLGDVTDATTSPGAPNRTFSIGRSSIRACIGCDGARSGGRFGTGGVSVPRA